MEFLGFLGVRGYFLSKIPKFRIPKTRIPKSRHCERSEAISRNSKFILRNSKFILGNSRIPYYVIPQLAFSVIPQLDWGISI